VRVPKQLPNVPVAAYERNLGDAKALLKKSAYGFVTEVVEMQIVGAGSLCSLFPYKSQPWLSYRENALIMCAFSAT